jgi:hypothetical protein
VAHQYIVCVIFLHYSKYIAVICKQVILQVRYCNLYRRRNRCGVHEMWLSAI